MFDDVLIERMQAWNNNAEYAYYCEYACWLFFESMWALGC